jgi:hypothetical protein
MQQMNREQEKERVIREDDEAMEKEQEMKIEQEYYHEVVRTEWPR